MKERDTYRLASALALAGVVVTAVATRFHAGAEPQNLLRVLPEYAANPYWTAAHLGQFLGFFLMTGGLILVLNDLRQKSRSPVAMLGVAAAIVAASTYAANYAVDGVAIQFAARFFVEAPAPERAIALGVAEAVRHLEQGLSGLATINMGIALALCAAAIISSRVVAGWLGWAAAFVAAAELVSGGSIYFLGFSQHVVGFWAGVSLLVWMLAAAVVLWRRSNRAVEP